MNWFLSGKGACQGCILLLCLFHLYAEYIMWMMKLKLESRLPGEISIISDMQMIPPVWQKTKNSKGSWWKLKRKVDKTQHSKNHYHGIPTHHFMANSWGNKTVTGFIFRGSKITSDGDCSHEIKRPLLLGRKTMTNLDYALKSRNITFPTSVRLVKAMVFPVVRWDLDHVKDLWFINWWFWTVALEKTLESPLDSNEIKLVNSKYSLEGLMLKLKVIF